jgi:hypothetical protein
MPIPPQGWIRIGNQYAAYQGIEPAPPAGTIQLTLASSIHPYGQLTVPIAVGETVEWVDCVMEDYPAPLGWVHPIEATTVWAAPVDTPLVLLATATVDPYSGAWPPLEGFVQDGRYSYAGATARAYADLTAFALPLHTAEWVTDDLHALPGRSQVIALSSDVVNPPINLTLTILRVELQFPLRTLPPRRTCTGGVVKPSTFMDLVVTESN